MSSVKLSRPMPVSNMYKVRPTQNLTLRKDWWTGTNPQGQRGLFPANYVTLLEGSGAEPEEDEAAPPPAPAPPPMPQREEPAAASKGKWAIAQYE